MRNYDGANQERNVGNVQAFAAEGLRPDIGASGAWDPLSIVVSQLQALPDPVTAQQLRDAILGLHGYAGINGFYDFRVGNQRGLGLKIASLFVGTLVRRPLCRSADPAEIRSDVHEFALSDELRDLQTRARKFVDTYLIPRERELSRTHRLSPKTASGSRQQRGPWVSRRSTFPRNSAAPGYGLLARAVVWAELGRSIALPPRNRGVMGPEFSPLFLHLNADQRTRFLDPVLRGEQFASFAQTEPNAGGDPPR